ncbi:CBS domain-containing protein [Streptomyces sp. NPDC006208]|uniref:CBS domain-containing protein n=1 Tax=Streptomyces sp. NPDC006208 TaxID=3156734 RepID=UPI0033BC6F1D
MKHDKVGTVMTSEVVRAIDTTPFKEVARLLAQHRISGLPVVDDDDKVIGVISETDLMAHRSKAGEDAVTPRRFRWSSITGRGRTQETKAHARDAGELMTHPAITVHAEQSIAEAARTMCGGRVERLPVVDEEDRLVGIVTRRDLLEVFLRPDAGIRREVIDEVLVRSLGQPPEAVRVDVKDGVVTVVGQLERRSEVPIALRMVGQVDGVISVDGQLGYRFDDSDAERSARGTLGPTDDRIRGVGR